MGLDHQADTVKAMVHDSLRALEEVDPDLAWSIIRRDCEVDDIHASMHGVVAEEVGRAPERVREMIAYLKISRELERIADHAVNICEDVIFIAEGKVARHHQMQD